MCNYNSKFKIILFTIIFFGIFGLAKNSWATAPVLNFSDITSGPKTGNTDGAGGLTAAQHGAIVTVWGNNLGSTQGSSKVYIGNVEAAHVYYWKDADGQLPGGPADLKTYHKMQEIAFAFPAVALDGKTAIKVKVNGVDSNTLPFTVRAGGIKFIKPAANGGNDLTGDGSWTAPWETLQSTVAGGNGKINVGDIVYSVGVGSVAGVGVGKTTTIAGTEESPISIAAYPGTKVNISGSENPSFTIYYYYSNPYWNWSKVSINTEVSGILVTRKNRIIGVEITGPNVYGGYTGAIGGGCNGVLSCNRPEGGKYLGIYIHNYGTDNGVPTAGNVGTDPSVCPYSNSECKNSWDKFQHLYYVSNRSGNPLEAYEIGWNNLIDNPIYSGIHVYDQTPCGDWTGTMKIHHNVVKNQRGSAINVDLANCTPRLIISFEIHDNIIINDSSVAFGGAGISIKTPSRTESPADQIRVYNNTVYGQISPSQFAYIGPNQHFINNIFVDTQNVDFFTKYDGYPSLSSNNVFYSLFGKAMPAWVGAGNVSLDPLFANPASFDFSLRSGSPAVNAGSDLALTTAPLDFFGQSRQSGNVSIGALQYIGAGSILDATPPTAPTGLTVN